MSSGSFWQVYVQCPFYQSDDGKNRVLCEGIGNSSHLSLYFRRRCDCENHLRVFCCEHYKKCEIYRMLMEKYDE